MNPFRFAAVLDFLRRHFVWVVGPLLIGIAGVLLAAACDYATYMNTRLLERFPYASLVLLPAGFPLIVYLVRRFFRGAEGSGVPQTIAAINDPRPRKNSLLLSVRILIGKVMMLTGGLFVGASIGRDGPAVQIGAAITHAFYGRNFMDTPEKRRMLVTVGGAAGIAVAFGTPLAAIMFTCEELSRSQTFKSYGRTVLAVVLATLVSVALIGQYFYFGSTPAFLNELAGTPAIVICGILGGVMGGIFCRMILRVAFRPPALLAELIRNRTLLFAAYCGVGVALLGLLTDNLVFGDGMEATRATLQASSSTHVWYYGLAKMGATFLSIISTIPAGLFAPSLAVGAGLGDCLSQLFPALAPHAAIVLLVMAAYLSGVTRAPLTALIITMEMANGFHMLLPLMAATLIANVVSKFISPTPLYHALAQRFS